MPTKDNAIGKVYAINSKTGEKFEIGEAANLDASLLMGCDFVEFPHPWTTSGTLSMISTPIQPKAKAKLVFGMNNNYIRFHGGKPLRTIRRRFLR